MNLIFTNTPSKNAGVSLKQVINPGDRIKKLFNDSFDILQNRLGLQNHPEGLQLLFTKKMDLDGEEYNAAGSTNNVDRYPMSMQIQKNPPIYMIATFSHEMHHVADMIKGDFVFSYPFWREKPKITYRNKKLDPETWMKARECEFESFVPHEIVAYNAMWSDAANIYEQMPPDIKEYLKMDLKGKDPIALLRNQNEHRRIMIECFAKDKDVREMMGAKDLDPFEGWRKI